MKNVNVVYIGSVALRHYGDEINGVFRTPSDEDIVTTYEGMQAYVDQEVYIKTSKKGEPLLRHSCFPHSDGTRHLHRFGEKGLDLIIETELAWEGSLEEEFMNLVMNDVKSLNYGHSGFGDKCRDVMFNFFVPSIDVLYMLKMSHRFKKNSPHFLKTMQDIHTLREMGASFDPAYMDWYDKRVVETYTYSHPNLMTNKSDFFKEKEVPYKYDHDTIHESIAIGDRPAYLEYKPEDQQVWCSKEMWDQCSDEIKLRGVVEEALTLALERSQIPFPNADPKWSFLTALEKVCTSITSGWFREWAWEHYHEAVALYETTEQTHGHYVNRFTEALKSGRIKPFK